jgi:hypothetical protein
MNLKSFEKFYNSKCIKLSCLYRVIINYCPIAVGVGDVVECAASLIK